MIFLYIVPLIVIILTYGGIICHLHRKDVRWTRDDEGKSPNMGICRLFPGEGEGKNGGDILFAEEQPKRYYKV
jgi:hypothetical protein